jgi:hypothetical protein
VERQYAKRQKPVSPTACIQDVVRKIRSPVDKCDTFKSRLVPGDLIDA